MKTPKLLFLIAGTALISIQGLCGGNDTVAVDQTNPFLTKGPSEYGAWNNRAVVGTWNTPTLAMDARYNLERDAGPCLQEAKDLRKQVLKKLKADHESEIRESVALIQKIKSAAHEQRSTGTARTATAPTPPTLADKLSKKKKSLLEFVARYTGIRSADSTETATVPPVVVPIGPAAFEKAAREVELGDDLGDIRGHNAKGLSDIHGVEDAPFNPKGFLYPHGTKIADAQTVTAYTRSNCIGQICPPETRKIISLLEVSLGKNRTSLNVRYNSGQKLSQQDVDSLIDHSSSIGTLCRAKLRSMNLAQTYPFEINISAPLSNDKITGSIGTEIYNREGVLITDPLDLHVTRNSPKDSKPEDLIFNFNWPENVASRE